MFLHEKAYQVRDTVIESSVVTKVKGIGRYAGRVLDTADYVTPPQVRGRRVPPLPQFPLSAGLRVTVTSPQGTSVFVVVTKQILTENQAQGVCPEVRAGDTAGAQGVSPRPRPAHAPLGPRRAKPSTAARPTGTAAAGAPPPAAVRDAGLRDPRGGAGLRDPRVGCETLGAVRG